MKNSYFEICFDNGCFLTGELESWDRAKEIADIICDEFEEYGNYTLDEFDSKEDYENYLLANSEVEI